MTSSDLPRYLAAAALILLLGSCAVDVSQDRETTVVYASGADLQSINPLVTVHPLAKAVQKHVLFMTLATYDSTLRPVPRLANWMWTEDRTVLTLQLRSDVFWHDGVRTTASDVVWTLETARHAETAYPRARELASIASIDVSDSLEVRLQFDRPQPVFPDVLADLAILPAHLFHTVAPGEIRTAPFNRNPVGNGPFEFVEYRPNQRWVFRRRDSFPADLGVPEVRQLAIVVVDEPATKLAALTSEELDFAGISPAHAVFVERDPRLRTIDYPILFEYALIWNLRRSPFDDVRVRRALAMALDRQLIVDAYLYGFGTVAHGPVPPEHPWHTAVDTIPFDRAGAIALLEQAGWVLGPEATRIRGSRSLSFDLLTVGSGDAPLEQMIQAQLREIGVSVRIRILELASFLARAQAAERDFDALVIGIPGDRSLGYIAATFGPDPGPLAYPGYSSAEFDAAVRLAQQAESEQGLRSAWAEVQRILARDVPTAWLYHARGLQGANGRIQDVNIDFRGELAGIASWRLGERK